MLTPHARFLARSLILGCLWLAGCGDGGVQVADAPGGNGAPIDAGGGGAERPVGTPPLVEPPSGRPTAELPDTVAAARLDEADVAAARLLAQASFGPTLGSIAAVRAGGSEAAWIDDQLSRPASLIEPYTRANSNGSNVAARHEAFWNNALSGEDQLRQRVAFALSQLFVISDVDYALANAQYGMANYQDMLSRRAFGTYRELLEAVTLHPAMGVYLSMVQNEKADPVNLVRPDENYAREVLQLFSLGLYELNGDGTRRRDGQGRPIPAYTQATVEAFARVFTGWDYPDTRYWGDTRIGGDQYVSAMQPNEAFHDSGAKTLLNGAVSPAGLSARADLEAALDNIAAHANVAPLVATHLIQRLVTSDPAPAYVARIAAVFDDDGAGVRGNLGAVVRALLLDPVARDGHLDDPDFGKLREPIVRLAHVWRALDAVPGPRADGVHNSADAPLYRLDELTGQAPMNSPSVFNFYLPDHPIVPGGERLSPEMQIMSEANLAATHNNYHHHVYRFSNRADLSDDNPRVSIIDLEPLVAIAGDRARLLDWYNLVFYAGGMPDGVRDILADYLGTLPDDDAGRFARVQDTLFMVLASPSFHLQR